MQEWLLAFGFLPFRLRCRTLVVSGLDYGARGNRRVVARTGLRPSWLEASAFDAQNITPSCRNRPSSLRRPDDIRPRISKGTCCSPKNSSRCTTADPNRRGSRRFSGRGAVRQDCHVGGPADRSPRHVCRGGAQDCALHRFGCGSAALRGRRSLPVACAPPVERQGRKSRPPYKRPDPLKASPQAGSPSPQTTLFHEVSRAEGPSQQATKSDGLPHVVISCPVNCARLYSRSRRAAAGPTNRRRKSQGAETGRRSCASAQDSSEDRCSAKAGLPS